MEKVTYRDKEKYCLVACVIDGEVLLAKKDQCYNSDSEEIKKINCFVFITPF